MTRIGGIYQVEGTYWLRPVSWRVHVEKVDFDWQLHRRGEYWRASDYFPATYNGRDTKAKYAQCSMTTPESMVNIFMQSEHGWEPCPMVWRVGDLPEGYPE